MRSPSAAGRVAVGPAGPDEATALAVLHGRCFARGWDAASLVTFLAAGDCLALAARGPQGAVHGFVLARMAGDEAEVLTLAVAPDRRREGSGERLMRALCARLAARGVRCLHLEVGAGNAAARGLYAKLGFAPVGVRRGYYREGPAGAAEDAHVLTRTLAAEATRPVVDAGSGRAYNEPVETEPADGARMRKSRQPEQMSRLERLCVDRGLRMTGQRRLVARVLSQAANHPDVEELYRRASEVDPRISLSTVYRTVRLFQEKGILERHAFADGRGRYEQVAREHHDHLIDVDTGQVIEFRSEEIEKLQEAVARKLGYKLLDHRLELYGVALKKKP